MTSEAPRRVQLPPRSEYRIELDSNESVAIRFVSNALTGHYGDAEVFGAPLVAGTQERWYTFGNEAKFAISSWGGAEIEIYGQASTEYMADEPSPFYTYGANLHLNLERARLRAREQLRTDNTLLQQLEELDFNVHNVPPSFESDGPLDASDPYRAAGQGPRVMVVGPASAGKSTLIKFLANYALRSPALASVKEGEEAKRRAREQEQQQDDSDEEAPNEETSDKPLSEITGWWPMIVSLDPAEGAVPIPGCISAIPLSPTPSNSLPSPSPALPYGVTPQTTGALPPGVSTAHSVMTLSLWMGKQNVRENERHSRRIIDWLAFHIEKRMAKDMRTRMSGLLIDTPGVITADARTRYAFIQYCVRALKVDTVIVVGHDKLNLELTRIYANNPTGSAPQIVKIPRSGGAVEVDEVYQQKLHDLQIRSYFYGMPLGRPRELGNSGETGMAAALGLDEPLGGVPSLNPYSSTIPFDLLKIYRIGQDRVAPSSALPIGAERALSEMQVVKLDPANSSSDLSLLLQSVLALVETPPPKADADSEAEREYTDDELLGASLLGFVHVYVVILLTPRSDVDTNRKKLTVLSPHPGKLPSITALIGPGNLCS
ncbi:polynucleotide 5'-hydroxyl-kinase [Malassezia caprae]|uniref:Polynucleotide 5'-hydroxyl-kinase GRC3 n=1 Tax=Malassezia caprae TaxID=1381934 RepID=A0AAF0E4B4_9BASI|nr:polynucleotide 5'-hydroxyl-kinase [Malassezia caprae]